MILIADSGSTKCSWAICNQEGVKLKECNTIGFNPYFINKETILKELKNSELEKYKKEITHVFFYGAGCSTKQKNKIIEIPFKEYFYKADININHDLDAACYAMYNNKPNITCILGTGSNSCMFDGKNIIENAPSLGFIMGDEASGNYFGKKILSLYFNKLLPKELCEKFEKKYEHNIDNINDNVYKSSRANVFLATYFPFVSDNKNHPIIKNLILNTLEDFINVHIRCFENYNNIEVNFIGSVSYFLQEEIKELSIKHNFKVGKILKNPINKLIDYHSKKLMKNNQVL